MLLKNNVFAAGAFIVSALESSAIKPPDSNIVAFKADLP